MQAYAEQHDTAAKRVLSYAGAALTTIPAGQTPAKDLADALDNIADHPNVAPFISRQLIQRLVTSNPSPQYVERIAQSLQRRWHRPARQSRRGGQGDPARYGSALCDDLSHERQAQGAAAAPHAGLARVRRHRRERHADGGRFCQAVFGQGPLQAPSVFNFFSPFYAPPGEISTQNLVAPELQIATEYQNTLVTNYLHTMAFCYVTDSHIDVPGKSRRQSGFSTPAAENALAGDPAALVDRVAERLLAGQISATLREQAQAQVARQPASVPSARAGEALYLIASSPEFAFQR